MMEVFKRDTKSMNTAKSKRPISRPFTMVSEPPGIDSELAAKLKARFIDTETYDD